jgi:hypothetical protein
VNRSGPLAGSSTRASSQLCPPDIQWTSEARARRQCCVIIGFACRTARKRIYITRRWSEPTKSGATNVVRILSTFEHRLTNRQVDLRYAGGIEQRSTVGILSPPRRRRNFCEGRPPPISVLAVLTVLSTVEWWYCGWRLSSQHGGSRRAAEAAHLVTGQQERTPTAQNRSRSTSKHADRSFIPSVSRRRVFIPISSRPQTRQQPCLNRSSRRRTTSASCRRRCTWRGYGRFAGD